MKSPSRVGDIALQTLPAFTDARGMLVEVSRLAPPVLLERAFVIFGSQGSLRGNHAHRRCTQALVVLRGSVRVEALDDEYSREFRLIAVDSALVVPPLIWLKLTFTEEATLMVLCDRAYEPEDYINSWSDFLEERTASATLGLRSDMDRPV